MVIPALSVIVNPHARQTLTATTTTGRARSMAPVHAPVGTPVPTVAPSHVVDASPAKGLVWLSYATVTTTTNRTRSTSVSVLLATAVSIVSTSTAQCIALVPEEEQLVSATVGTVDSLFGMRKCRNMWESAELSCAHSIALGLEPALRVAS